MTRARPAGDPAVRRQLAAWLFVCCALVFATLVVGGITRMTRSGLSIVEWQPIVGVLPPLSEAQWQAAFDQYRLTPEYRLVNRGMSLADFKGIYWWEYAHRLLGRAIGLAFLLPLLYFVARARLEARLLARLLGFFVLGGLQGALGWFMVKSGLVDDPRVSHLRLTAHLGLAFLIFALMFWTALDLLAPRASAAPPEARLRRVQRAGAALVALVFLMVLSGALVAGTRAGLAYNNFPLMDGHLLPPDLFALEPWYLNFVNNMATVQFDHRLLAWSLALCLPWFWHAARRAAPSPRARLACHVALAAAAVQIALGIATLLLRLPLPLAAGHQGGAMLVLAALLWANHELRRGAPAGG